VPKYSPASTALPADKRAAIARAARNDGGIIACYWVSAEHNGKARDILIAALSSPAPGTFFPEVRRLGIPAAHAWPSVQSEIPVDPFWTWDGLSSHEIG
jgi:hypothetical protein